jgi:Ca-activated chloride channel homolog
MLSRWRLTLLAALLTSISVAQDVNNVHWSDSGKEKLHAATDAPLDSHPKPFISNVDLVLVPVTVTDEAMRIVTGLGPSQFTIMEDYYPQTIKYFYAQDAPISVSVIIDTDRRKSSLEASRYAASKFIKASNANDEFFLIFSDKPRLVTDFTNRPEDIEATLRSESPNGATKRYDAMYLGLSKMKEAKNARQVLMVFSDGSGNSSHYSEKELVRYLHETDVQVFFVSLCGTDYLPDSIAGAITLVGGRLFPAPSSFADAAERIAVELRNEYVLGYVSSNRARDGKLRKIKVKFIPPRGLPPLLVSTKKGGYYAPTE